MRSVRTPLARARGLGSAASGTEHFWRERLTSVFGLPLTIASIAIVLSTLGADHATAAARLGHPLVAIVLILTLLNTCIHMRIGMQVIIEDYVHDELPKYAALMGNTFFSCAIGLTAVFAILKLSFGL